MSHNVDKKFKELKLKLVETFEEKLPIFLNLNVVIWKKDLNNDNDLESMYKI